MFYEVVSQKYPNKKTGGLLVDVKWLELDFTALLNSALKCVTLIMEIGGVCSAACY
jgi:hypothetical protein